MSYCRSRSRGLEQHMNTMYWFVVGDVDVVYVNCVVEGWHV